MTTSKSATKKVAKKPIAAEVEPALTPEEVQAQRAVLGIPDDGEMQRAWIRYQLQLKGWSQARIARATYASTSTVSYIYTGQRPAGHKADRVRRLTAEVVGVREDVLFPEARDVAERREQERALLHDLRRERRIEAKRLVRQRRREEKNGAK